MSIKSEGERPDNDRTEAGLDADDQAFLQRYRQAQGPLALPPEPIREAILAAAGVRAQTAPQTTISVRGRDFRWRNPLVGALAASLLVALVYFTAVPTGVPTRFPVDERFATTPNPAAAKGGQASAQAIEDAASSRAAFDRSLTEEPELNESVSAQPAVEAAAGSDSVAVATHPEAAKVAEPNEAQILPAEEVTNDQVAGPAALVEEVDAASSTVTTTPQRLDEQPLLDSELELAAPRSANGSTPAPPRAQALPVASVSDRASGSEPTAKPTGSVSNAEAMPSDRAPKTLLGEQALGRLSSAASVSEREEAQRDSKLEGAPAEAGVQAQAARDNSMPVDAWLQELRALDRAGQQDQFRVRLRQFLERFPNFDWAQHAPDLVASVAASSVSQ